MEATAAQGMVRPAAGSGAAEPRGAGRRLLTALATYGRRAERRSERHDRAPAGWYDDPTGRFEHRYFDGNAWTEHVSRGERQLVDSQTKQQASVA